MSNMKSKATRAKARFNVRLGATPTNTKGSHKLQLRVNPHPKNLGKAVVAFPIQSEWITRFMGSEFQMNCEMLVQKLCDISRGESKRWRVVPVGSHQDVLHYTQQKGETNPRNEEG